MDTSCHLLVALYCLDGWREWIDIVGLILWIYQREEDVSKTGEIRLTCIGTELAGQLDGYSAQ